MDEPAHDLPPVRLCLLGAPPDTGNLGVTALLQGTLTGLAPHLPDADITVFDNGFGVRPAGPLAPGARAAHRLVGLRVSRRYHRAESLANVRLSARLGGLRNPAAQALRASDAVLDISGGDSFCDLYSRMQQRIAFEPKRLVLSLGRPLVLLPQTYGPFTTEAARQAAVEILRRCHMTWARDHDSYRALQALLGDEFDPARDHEGVDVAFQLPVAVPADPLPDRLARWLVPERSAPAVGVNVSGLLHTDPTAQARYGLAGSYRDLTHALIRRLLDDTDANILLVPHVLGEGRSSDERAVTEVQATVPLAHRERVMVAPALATPGTVKWLVSQLDWFCGARMHATIAALSSGVPTAGLAYSPKMHGVFASCGLAAEITDLRLLDERAALSRLTASWQRRRAVRARLSRHLPRTLASADEQARLIATTVRAGATHPAPTVRSRAAR